MTLGGTLFAILSIATVVIVVVAVLTFAGMTIKRIFAGETHKTLHS